MIAMSLKRTVLLGLLAGLLPLAAVVLLPAIGDANELGRATSAAVSCSPNPLVKGKARAKCSATVTDVSPNGFSPTGTVNFETNRPGFFSGPGVSCSLVVAVVSSSCTVEYTPSEIADGQHRITISYAGDDDHKSSSGATVEQVKGVGVEDLDNPPQDPKKPDQPGTPDKGSSTKPGQVAPNTALGKRPKRKTARHRAKFTFVSDQPGASFECSLDKRPYKACTSPWRKRRLKTGRHLFMVRAKNSAGVPDSTPAVYRWRVRSSHPRTQP
ncbi:MAG TPA: Ig-like domain-containing protein [Solirubrobacterales bacterium]|nr:Ig-like domain-containing protein [Solirubrobacterales bacterium]